MFVAIDIETTGFNPRKHAMIELAIIPLKNDFTINENIEPFCIRIKAGNKEVNQEALEVNGLNPAEGYEEAEALEKLFTYLGQLELEQKEKLIPIGQNYTFDHSFLKVFMGSGEYRNWFSRRFRDTMVVAAALEDYQTMTGGKKLFEGLGLEHLCSYFDLTREKAHTAMSDAIDTAKVYQCLLFMQATHTFDLSFYQTPWMRELIDPSTEVTVMKGSSMGYSTQSDLFKIEKSKAKFYQVRLVKSEDDEGEVLATFKHVDHTGVMAKLTLAENEDLIVTEFTEGEGVTDMLATCQIPGW